VEARYDRASTRQVVIVMLSHEINPAQKAHRLQQARVKRDSSHFFFVQHFKSSYQVFPTHSQPFDDALNGNTAVTGNFRSAILPICRRQYLGMVQKLFQALTIEREEIDEMAEVFFHRPLAIASLPALADRSLLAPLVQFLVKTKFTENLSCLCQMVIVVFGDEVHSVQGAYQSVSAHCAHPLRTLQEHCEREHTRPTSEFVLADTFMSLKC
jgi:hypothetical protein